MRISQSYSSLLIKLNYVQLSQSNVVILLIYQNTSTVFFFLEVIVFLTKSLMFLHVLSCSIFSFFKHSSASSFFGIFAREMWLVKCLSTAFFSSRLHGHGLFFVLWPSIKINWNANQNTYFKIFQLYELCQ